MTHPSEKPTQKKTNKVPSFIICNEGYTIERLIHGMEASYNDIQPWKHTNLVETFGGTSSDSKTFQIKTKLEAENLFTDKDFASAPYLQVRLLIHSCNSYPPPSPREYLCTHAHAEKFSQKDKG